MRLKALGWPLCLGLLALFSGCTSPTIYSWGRYETLVYTMYAAPDKATAAIQVIKMEEDFQKARSKNKPVHPGFHAHLGYLYFQLGKADEAKRAFDAEKTDFPESAVVVDRMLANLQKK